MADYGNLIDLISHPSKLIIRPVAELSKRHSNVKFNRIEFEELPDPPVAHLPSLQDGEIVADVITVKPRDLQEKIEAFVEEAN
ncbi:thioredoxin [Penicillium canescens]|nr:thioredoxin [Penicillium canescens]